MTWKQALHAIHDPDGFMESLDPFYVPNRTDEISSFIIGAFWVAMAAFGLFFLPLTVTSLAAIGGLFIPATISLVAGLRRRAYRLARMRAAAQLRAGFLT